MEMTVAMTNTCEIINGIKCTVNVFNNTLTIALTLQQSWFSHQKSFIINAHLHAVMVNNHEINRQSSMHALCNWIIKCSINYKQIAILKFLEAMQSQVKKYFQIILLDFYFFISTVKNS